MESYIHSKFQSLELVDITTRACGGGDDVIIWRVAKIWFEVLLFVSLRDLATIPWKAKLVFLC